MIEEENQDEKQSQHREKQERTQEDPTERLFTSPVFGPYDKSSHKVPEKSLKSSEEILGRIAEILENQPSLSKKQSTKQIDRNGSLSSGFKCKCKKTKCLKMYCECFAVGKVCNGCGCSDCNNLLSFEKQRANALDEALGRDPDLFKLPSQRQKKQGCICKKTGCLKKYCECYSSGFPCGPECKCINCNNS